MTKNRNHGQTRLARRQMLKALGLGAGSLLFPSMAPVGRASSATGLPCRIVFMMSYHGTVYDNWSMRPGNPNTNASWDADLTAMTQPEFSQILRPLHGFRDTMMVLDGLDLVTIKPLGGGIGHSRSPVNSMTGAITTGDGNGTRSTAPSIDQIIAERIARPDHFTSVEMGHRDTPISSAVAAQPLPRLTRPEQVFDRLFPNPSDPAGPPTPGVRLRERQGSVLDSVAQDFEGVTTRLSTEDRQKLSMHADMVRDLEVRLDGLAAIDCSAPARPTTPPNSNPERYNEITDSYSALVATAFACDLTRVATITLEQMPNSAFGAPAGDVHQDFAHRADPPNPDALAVTQMTNYNRRHAEHVLELVQLLDSVPEDAGTMLDNTLVVWLNEMANGTHRQDPYPMVLFGGANIPLDWGRYLFWPSNGPVVAGSNGYNSQRGTGLPQNKALAAIAQAMGLTDLSSIGDTSVATEQGGTIDCSGVADRMLA